MILQYLRFTGIFFRIFVLGLRLGLRKLFVLCDKNLDRNIIKLTTSLSETFIQMTA